MAIENSKRIPVLDQMRGYAIFGMLLVNANDLFHLHWEQLNHHRERFTYADTIAPMFMFVVGMGMRISWLRRSARDGVSKARQAMAKRLALLVLIGFALYAGYYWDALMDIGLAGLLALPFLDKNCRVRILAAVGMVTMYQALYMFTVYGQWVTGVVRFDGENTPLLVRLIPLNEELFKVALNGGPLGPLSWCLILLFGTVASDLLVAANERTLLKGCLGWGTVLCAAGYLLHLEWPGVKASWPFSAALHDRTVPVVGNWSVLLPRCWFPSAL